MNNIILFDGECNFCNESIQFIMRREKNAHYQFASIQGDVGQELLKKFHVPENLDSLILVEDNKCYYKSSAALRICKHLKGGWSLLPSLLIIPTPLRDAFYDLVAKNRYKWFGNTENCEIPLAEKRKRFL